MIYYINEGLQWFGLALISFAVFQESRINFEQNKLQTEMTLLLISAIKGIALDDETRLKIRNFLGKLEK